MSRRATLALLVVCGLAPLVLDHVARSTATHDLHHGGLVDERLLPKTRSVLPGLRALIVQFWMVRIDLALRRDDRVAALRFAREALAVGPDLVVARARLAQVLAFDVAGHEFTPRSRVGWIGEALRILDEGLEREPSAAPLHLARGIILWMRGESVPEFASEFEQRTGRTAFSAAADSMTRAAELAPFDYTTLWYASTVLAARAESYLDRAKSVEEASLAGDAEAKESFVEALVHARDDYARVARFAGTSLALLDEPTEYSQLFAEHAKVSAELLALESKRLLDREVVDAERIAVLRTRRNELGAAIEVALQG